MVIDVKPQGSVSYDSFDAEGERCFREFETNKDQPLLLLKSADAYEKSTNPDGKKIAVLLRGLYHREKGVKETDHKKAAIELSKAVRLFTRVTGKDAIETKKVKLEYLKRELATHLKDEKPPKELFLQRAELFKELKDEKSYNGDMAIYYMFSMLELEPFDDNFLKFANLMLAHADKSGQEELSYKAKVLLHQAKSSIAPDPKTSLAELEEALIAIQKTTDHFGEEDTKARLLFMRGMLTVDKKKRTTLIQEAAVKWNELGNKKEAARAIRMITPIPINVAAILHFADETIQKQQELGKTINHLIIITPGPYAVFHHHSHLFERIKDVKKIVKRLGQNRKAITDLTFRKNKIEPKRIIPGKPFSKQMQKILNKQNELTELMRLDMESLYVFGNLLLDQWSHTMAYLLGYSQPEECSFARLYDLISSKSDGPFDGIKKQHSKDIYWLYYQLRSYRNVFIEHVKRPWQRGNTMSVYGDDFNLFIPTPPGWIDDKQTEEQLKSIYPLAPKILKDMPDDYWEKKSLRRVLEVTFFHIDGIEKKEDREKVWDVWKNIGGSTPSYDVIASRLINFILSSTITITDIIKVNPKAINLGGNKIP